MDLSDKFKGVIALILGFLTKKSKLGFGYQDIKELRIQDLLIANKHKELIRIYFA